MPKDIKSSTVAAARSSRRVVWWAFAVCATLIFIVVSDSSRGSIFTGYNIDGINTETEISPEEIAQLRRGDLDMLGLSSSTMSSSTLAQSSKSAISLDDRSSPESIVLTELSRCTTLDCITQVFPRLNNTTKFNFPHFMIVGWQKSATTSVYHHLLRHPEILKPFIKEPHFFSSCQFGGPACRVPGGNNERAYIRDTFQIERAIATGISLATLDASVDYAQREGLARRLRSHFPWLKVVFVLRERVGRAMSWKNMLQQKFNRGCSGAPGPCLVGALRKTNYSQPMKEWFDAFPADQIHVMQFEELVEDPDGVLLTMKVFLGLDPDQPPAELRNVNARTGSSGWPVERSTYQGLVDDMRADAQELMTMMKEYHIDVDESAWMKRWEEVWQRNMDTCENGTCSIRSS